MNSLNHRKKPLLWDLLQGSKAAPSSERTEDETGCDLALLFPNINVGSFQI
jgi:hypothetical protein